MYIQNFNNSCTANISQDQEERRETARLHQGRNIINGIEDQEVEKINGIQEALDKAIHNIVIKDDTQASVAKRLYPIIRNEAQLSKILAKSGKDKRHVNLKLMVALRYVYHLDLNKLVDDLMTS